MPPTVPGGRAGALIQALGLAPHPEGGWYRELFRSAASVQPLTHGGGRDVRGARAALTSIDFVLGPGERSAWHRVQSDEAWHLLEGGPLLLWLVPPTLNHCERVQLGAVAPGQAPRHVVPAGWWQAAEPLTDWAYVGATVGPGFDFADFSFGRDLPALGQALDQLNPALRRLL